MFALEHIWYWSPVVQKQDLDVNLKVHILALPPSSQPLYPRSLMFAIVLNARIITPLGRKWQLQLRGHMWPGSVLYF